MIITKQIGKETIFKFLDAGNNILRDNFENSCCTKDSIIDMAFAIPQDAIRSQPYDMSSYPSFKYLDSDSLSALLLKICFS